jgi:Tol biopolymer transport system component
VDVATGLTSEVFGTDDVLLEAPSWLASDTMILNGGGALWRLALDTGELERIDIPGLPDVNNDHVQGVDGDTMFVSCWDGHLYRVTLSARTSTRITTGAMYHFLHGVSPDGSELAFVGIEPGVDGRWSSANIFTVPSDGGDERQLTSGDRPDDGPEYSPDGEWIYFNTEGFSDADGHAQIARMRRDGSGLTQLTFDDRVNWFPHLAPSADGTACYLAYPPGTTGHPADRDVEILLVTDDDWPSARTVARLVGGQGTINVNSWSPDSETFAYVSYPDGVDSRLADGDAEGSELAVEGRLCEPER